MNAFSLMILPVMLSTALLVVVWHRHWAVQSIEQAKIDATTLSLCHQTAKDLNSKLGPSNTALSFLRASMTTMGTICIAEAAAVIAYGAYVPKMMECNQRLRPFSEAGKLMEFAQAQSIESVIPIANWDRFVDLVQKNQLKLEHFKEIERPELSWQMKFGKTHPVSQGFVRKEVSSAEEMMEDYISSYGLPLEWPEKLIANNEASTKRRRHDGQSKNKFEARFSYGLQYDPPSLVHLSERVQQEHLIDPQNATIKQYRPGGFNSQRRSEAYCYIEEKTEGQQYEVQIDYRQNKL